MAMSGEKEGPVPSAINNFGYMLTVWGALGFLHGAHWWTFPCLASQAEPSEERMFRWHGISYIVGILVTMIGGGYCQSGTARACPGGEDMSPECLFSEQTTAYQAIYILHYVGLAWNFSHWVMDGFHLWPWSRQLARGEALRLLMTDFKLNRYLYSCIIWSAVALATLTWTALFRWTTGAGDEPSTLNSLAAVLLVEFVSVLLLSCILFRVLPLLSARKHSPSTA
mmetsp:Transcript_70658/g.165696  ORF Transcript_70658/g.165696 Transcript_70658/m.165696 type:complete len:225 (+) Transcript_70658:126-800(+)